MFTQAQQKRQPGEAQGGHNGTDPKREPSAGAGDALAAAGRPGKAEDRERLEMARRAATLAR